MPKKLVDGNEAIVQGALRAGLGFYAGYPITPASEIMQGLSKSGIAFVNAEDEIASVSMVIGASLAGKKSMTATSGPGFSLMQEGIGLAHMMRVPVVIVNSQRVGPSTGMPTLAAQGDILQAYHGSHGDFVSIAFYPNSVEECYKYTIEAFNAAEEAKCPVYLLTDGMLSHLFESVDLDAVKISLKQRDLKPLGHGSRHFTGLLSKEGIPKTKDSIYYRQWYKSYKDELSNAADNYKFYEYIENNNSDTLVISYGILSRAVFEFKGEFALFRPIRIFPLLEEIKEISQKYKTIIVVEMNDSQYALLLEAFLKREIKKVPVLGGLVAIDELRKGLLNE
ncbi:MAG TPA: 2-oxoacid:acceptor oxidoreductase subunit alpha [Nanoarchaeota archaeon]|nr:2-oxoacid:acceptor oxidoreductase subunit alpha [Nanoarchaeota archaeon]